MCTFIFFFFQYLVILYRSLIYYAYFILHASREKERIYEDITLETFSGHPNQRRKNFLY